LTQGQVEVNFLGTSGMQTVSTSTSLDATTYPTIGLRGFGQTGPTPTVLYVSEAYFSNVAGTWHGVMSGENQTGSDVGYNIYYYYR
jgi:hypothetical protein